MRNSNQTGAQDHPNTEDIQSVDDPTDVTSRRAQEDHIDSTIVDGYVLAFIQNKSYFK